MTSLPTEVALVVYAVTAWFGSDEWVESMWLHEKEADNECTRLWVDRRSEKHPGFHAQGLVKFGVEPMSVKRVKGEIKL